MAEYPTPNQTQDSDSASANLAPETVATQPFGTPVISEKTVSTPVIVSIICAILAVAGCSFGLFELFQNLSQSKQIERLQITINNKEQEIATLKTRADIMSQTETQTDTRTETQTDNQADTQAETQTDNQADVQTETENQTDNQTETHD